MRTFATILFALLLVPSFAYAQEIDSTLRVVTIDEPMNIARMDTMGGSTFSTVPPTTGLTGTMVYSKDAFGEPSEGCEPFDNAGEMPGNIALVSRGTCAFALKTQNAFDAGAIGIIIYMDDRNGPTDSTLVIMSGDCVKYPNACGTIPAAFAPRFWFTQIVEPNMPGIVVTMFPVTVVDIEPGPDGLPGTHNLTAAYPNPFNPSTQFALEVAEAQDVTIEVVNTLGQRVALLHDGLLSAGVEHQFTFEANGLPSGVYLYRAQGETFEQSRQVTLVK